MAMISIPTDQGALDIDVGDVEITNDVLDRISDDLIKNGYTFKNPVTEMF